MFKKKFDSLIHASSFSIIRRPCFLFVCLFDIFSFVLVTLAHTMFPLFK